MLFTAFVPLLLLLATLSARAADAPTDVPDEAALQLADKTLEASAQSSTWRVFAEGAASRVRLRDGSSSAKDGSRVALDARWDFAPLAGVRTVVSDRLDVVKDDFTGRRRTVNSLREAYVSWHGHQDVNFDAGRVNLRNGVAWGYNPTDFFKDRALRTVVASDPTSLRQNRMGTVLLQVQEVWAGSSLGAAYSPKLGDAPSARAFSLDLGATNSRNRWLLSATRKLTEELNSQFLIYGAEHTQPQLGLNLSTLLNSATVVFAEYAAGKSRSLIAQSSSFDEGDRWHQRAALGFTYTTTFNLSLTAEGEFSGAAPDRVQWHDLRSTSSIRAAHLAETAQTLQELPVRRAAFFYAIWKDAVVRRLDFSGFWREDLETRSREQWLETRYHLDRVELALQWQTFSGRADSFYRSQPVKQRVELSARGFF